MPDKGNFGAVVEYFDHHPNDSRLTGPHDTASTVAARYGTGGGNVPLVKGNAMGFYPKEGRVFGTSEGLSVTLKSQDAAGVLCGASVRRLTPVECERLQGFPDNYTRIPWGKKQEGECPDGPRYKALGNSMAVPVMKWIGKRIQMVEQND